MESSHRELVTENNKSPLIQILAWMFLVIAVLSCIARTGTKLHMVNKLRLEDWFAISATVAACGQYFAHVASGYKGLGKHMDILSPDDINNSFKAQYAADILFITGLFFAKTTTAMMTMNISQRSHKRAIQGIALFVALWAATGLLVVFFQCHLPRPWHFAAETCIQRAIFWSYFSAVNIVTDLILIGIMVENVRRIQTSWSKKTLVISVFGSRIFVTPAIIAQIFFFNKTSAAADPTFDTWPLAIAMETVTCASILAICIPNLKPFLDSLESGQIRVDDLRRQGKSSSGGYASNNRDTSGHTGQERGTRSRTAVGTDSRGTPRDPMVSKTSQKGKMFELADLRKTKKGDAQQASHGGDRDGDVAWDGQSHTSQTILIQQTKTWYVDVEERNSSE